MNISKKLLYKEKMLKNIQLKIIDKKISKLPNFSTEGSAGLDLRASLDSPLSIQKNEVKLIPTGIAIHINNKNYAGIILPRSGLGHKNGIVLGNLVGLIDSDYQGELKISCWNRSKTDYIVEPYDRIAQLVFININQPEFSIVENFEDSQRGEDGFGSSGKK
tara:strand:- start:451 stop:936 length:486 start_codon:yes stop_codon:yes gene_type:complete